MTSKLHVGTSGYSYKEWKGSFYPDDLPSTRFLDYYAEHFGSVEINNTFYRFPSAKVLEGWFDSTPEGFCFALKAHSKVTHKMRLKDAGEFVSDWVGRCRTLGARLGPLLFQLPPYLRFDLARLTAFLDVLPNDVRCAIEFRHRSWFTEEVFSALRAHNVGLCLSEDDEFETPREITSDFIYVRLRKEQYEEDQLREWRGWYEPQLAAGTDVYVYIKHDEEGASPVVALNLLAGSGADETRPEESARKPKDGA